MRLVPYLLLLSIASSVLQGCHRDAKPLFEELSPEATGITFRNDVKQDGENNVLNYPYYFNGGGVAVGDLNNDGLLDVYFTGNQVPNKLYLNQTRSGADRLSFKDITASAGVAAPEGWKTGVTMADVNGDGWLDIYVCRSAMGDSTLRRNLLYINNKNLTFTEKAAEYGLADDSYSTQAAFLDYDRDGDLDLFLLNHSLPKYAGLSNLLADFKQQKSDRFGSKLFRNDGGPTPHFTDVTEAVGLINNVLSFGLGIAVSDVNADGWPDLYVSNDFNEEDYLYLNEPTGSGGARRFRNVVREATGHTSLFSMGSDVADINNDARPDILTLDMMPATNERIKLSSGDDNYDKYLQLLRAGFHPQTMRNMLQLNAGNDASGTPIFSEIGQLSGISNTDWSWAALWSDYDGDGWKDLFVTNGYEKDYTNMQFLKFTVDERVKSQQGGQTASVQQILDQMPAIDVGAFLFRNNADSGSTALTFSDVTKDWGIRRTFKANGAAYADLDNDGDMDLLANVMNGPAAIYRNRAVEDNGAQFLKIDLTKANPTRSLIGTKVWVYSGKRVQYEEFSPVRGYQSCLYAPLSVGMAGHPTADSVRVVYPDNHMQVFRNVPVKNGLRPRYEDARQMYAYPKNNEALFSVMPQPGWVHTPVDTNDFKRQLLLPYQYSYDGPKLATGDVNGDGRVDVYVCGPKGQSGTLWLQGTDGTLQRQAVPAFEADRQSQDEAAAFVDADGDGLLDLYVVSGGYLFAENDPLLQDRLYKGDGQGHFTKMINALPKETLAGSCVAPLDVDGDGDQDLFVGTRFIPGKYPLSGQSQLLVNDGRGHFTEKNSLLDGIVPSDMICDVEVVDLNRDRKPDLIVAGEWMPLKVLINEKGRLMDQSAQWLPANTQGWWNCLTAGDYDRDGDIDFVAGNYGLNAQFRASVKEPVQLQYKDFDNNGQIDPFLAYYVGGKSYPFASRDEALGQVNSLRARFPDYNQYANATMTDLFTEDERKDVQELKATWLQTTYWENRNGHFVARPLPVQAQFAPVFALESFDYDADGDLDLLAGGNLTQARVRVGRSDASYLPVFENQKGTFRFKANAGVRGDVRGLAGLNSSEVVVGVNGGPLVVLKGTKQRAL